MASLAALRAAALAPRPVETYYPTIGTRLHVATTEAGLALHYEAGCRLQPESLRFAFAESATPGCRVLTIEIEYSSDLRCPSEL